MNGETSEIDADARGVVDVERPADVLEHDKGAGRVLDGPVEAADERREVGVVHDREAVLAAFEAQDDVLGLPDDWEASLGCDFIVENYDNQDSTYVLVKPGAFDETSHNAKDGKWWPYSVVVLLP